MPGSPERAPVRDLASPASVRDKIVPRRGRARATPAMSDPLLPAEDAPHPRPRGGSDPVQVLRQLLRRLDRSRRALVGARREQIREQAGAALVALARHDARAALPALSRLALALPRQRPAAAAYAALAHVHYELGRYRRAIAVAREAQRLDPRSGLAAAVSARAYAALFPVVR